MPQEIIITIINWALGLVGLICVLAISIGFPGFIIALIVEASRNIPNQQKRSFKWTMIFGFSFLIGLFLIIGVMALWGIAIYLATNF